MAEEPYYTPGQSDGVPPQSPTEFTPQKPAGPDPVSPQPLPEGSEEARHAQLFAFDSGSGTFRPINWVDGKLDVNATFSGTIEDVTITNWIDQDFTVIQTQITRDPATDLVSLIAETDGVRTKNTVFTRDANNQVASIQEVLVV